MRMNRRDCLLQCLALGSLRVVPGLALADAVFAFEAQESRRRNLEPQFGTLFEPTPANPTGPVYRRAAPNRPRLRAAKDPGLPLHVGGRVQNTHGDLLSAAKVEVCQADHLGHYDPDGIRYRASLPADSGGKYWFDSVMPGHYPQRVCQHIHYAVTAPGHRPLITQLYFATDPVFEGDPDHTYSRDPFVRNRELVRPVTLVGDPGAIEARVDFDLVLERL